MNEPKLNEPKIIWLLGLKPAPAKPPKKLWAKIRRWLLLCLCRLTFLWPRLLVQKIGRLPDETPVQLLELPYTKAEFRGLAAGQRRQLLRQALDWLATPANRAKKIGLPLHLQILLNKQPGQSPPPLLADGWQLAAREFVRQTAEKMRKLGGLQGKQVAVLGVDNLCPAERHICDALLAAGSQPVLYGAHALGLAEYYYQKYGVAIPVFGARKAIRSSAVILVLNGLPHADSQPHSKPVFYFREPYLTVPGKFSGRFAFGSFPAGQAAAMLEQTDNS